MRKLFSFIMVLAVVVVGLGFYLGWFGVSTTHDSTSGKTGVELTIDQNKIKADAEKAKEKVADEARKLKEKAEQK